MLVAETPYHRGKGVTATKHAHISDSAVSRLFHTQSCEGCGPRPRRVSGATVHAVGACGLGCAGYALVLMDTMPMGRVTASSNRDSTRR